MAAIGYGEHRPVAGNDNEEGRQRNRRVTLVIQGTKDQPVALPPELDAAAHATPPAADPEVATLPATTAGN
jgi:chemotaxis protein MotB